MQVYGANRLRNALCAWLVILPSIAYGKTATLTLGSAYAKPGWTVDLPVTLSGGAQPAALQWSFRYSADITKVTFVAGASTKAAGKKLDCSANTCLLFGFNTATLADGVVAVATFEIAAKPASTTIEVAITGVVASDAHGFPITASGASGKISLPGPPPERFEQSADERLLKFSPEGVDEAYMDRRLHPRAQVHFETKVTNLNTQQSVLGRTCDISESGISVVQALELVAGDQVQLEMADSVLSGRVAYANREGEGFRVGIEVQKVHLGDSSLSSLLQKTLEESMPTLPGVEDVEPQFS